MKNHNRKIIYLAGFLFSIPIALTSYINSSYLEQSMSKFSVSMLYVLASIITILGMLVMPRTLTRFGNRKATIIFAITGFASLMVLSFASHPLPLAVAFIIFFATSNFLIATLDIFVEDFSKNTSIGKFRGLFLVVINLAWVVAQSVSGSIIARSSFAGIYIFSAMFMLLFACMFALTLKEFVDPKYKRVPVFRTLKFFIINKNISKIYLLNFILKFFYVWMIVYTPIYLHEYVGFSWQVIGPLFTIMLLPFVLLSFPLGKWSDKIGEKKMLTTGFVIAVLSTFLIPFIIEPKFWVWAVILFATRVGAATIEVMSESYFFKLENQENPDAISFFRNTTPLSYVVAPLVAILVLLYLPSFSYIFYILGTILLVGLYITLRIRDVK